jgi:hypothetical protein
LIHARIGARRRCVHSRSRPQVPISKEIAMNVRFALAPLVLAAAAVSAHAQQVSLRGKVEDMPGQPGRFIVGCTAAELTSSVIDLKSFVDQQVELTGSWNGSSAAPVVDVATMGTVAKLFEVGGGGQIGTDLSFKVTSSPGDFTIMFAALDSGFMPAHKAGVLLLSLTPMLTVASGFVAPDGTLEVKGQIPNDPTLVGVEVHGQAFVSFIAGGATLSNPDCVTLHS